MVSTCRALVAMETDSVPLLVVDPGPDEEGGGGEQPDFKKMVFFHGKVSHLHVHV